ncbi:MAG: TIGR04086 family membrane protein [Ruminococcaceae bacterium]|nr:TIGR04086 family membrane protein [Oscillospiraceae bacterium]
MVKNTMAVNTENDKSWGRGIFKGVLISLAISFLAFVVFAFILMFLAVDENIVSAIAVCISMISVFAGSYVSARIVGQKGWLWGGICGLAYYVILYISALAAIKEFNFSLKTLVMMLIGTLVGMIGGIFGINSGAKKRRR